MARNKDIQLTTPVGTALFPRLSEPDYEFNDAGIYSVKLVLPEDHEFVQNLVPKLEKMRDDQFNKEMEALREKNPRMSKAKLKEKLKLGSIGVIPEEDGETGEATGNVILNFGMKAEFKDDSGKRKVMAPKLFDAVKRAIKPKQIDGMWSGSKIRVAFTPKAYYTTQAGVGVKLYLKAVQVLEVVKGGGNADSYGFEEEDGFDASTVETDSDDVDDHDDDDSGDVDDHDDF